MNTAWLEGIQVIAEAEMSLEKSGLTRSVYLSPEEIFKAAANLRDQEYFIEDISVLDTSDGFMVVYHFDHFEQPGRVALRVLVPHSDPTVPTISEVFPGAGWHEREGHDFFGLIFSGHKNLLPLLLPENADIHPLIKEDTSRKRIADLMLPGDIKQSTADFEALFAPPGDKADEEGEKSKK